MTFGLGLPHNHYRGLHKGKYKHQFSFGLHSLNLRVLIYRHKDPRQASFLEDHLIAVQEEFCSAENE